MYRYKNIGIVINTGRSTSTLYRGDFLLALEPHDDEDTNLASLYDNEKHAKHDLPSYPIRSADTDSITVNNPSL